MTQFAPDPAEQAARICDMQAAIFDDDVELLAAGWHAVRADRSGNQV